MRGEVPPPSLLLPEHGENCQPQTAAGNSSPAMGHERWDGGFLCLKRHLRVFTGSRVANARGRQRPRGFNHADAGSNWRVRGRKHGRRSPLFVLPPLFCFLADITAALCPLREWEARGGRLGSDGGGRRLRARARMTPEAAGSFLSR